ncbi:uncharacterized protein LOC141812766 [Curcuma longa]|uniref:uncharacterized protein LOC141812766 n=1 Tax=Curcuma longa TaxID=136217 RepID=UPI003D9F6B56
MVGGSKKNALYGLASHARVAYDHVIAPRARGRSSSQSNEVRKLKLENQALRDRVTTLEQSEQLMDNRVRAAVEQSEWSMYDRVRMTFDHQMQEFFDHYSIMSLSAFSMPYLFAPNLEELYTGTKRKMKISREVRTPNGKTVEEHEILTIEVTPGWRKGTKVTFPEKVNEELNQIPADLVFIIDEKPHEVYKREGNDLVVHQKISLVDALAGTTINLVTLDGCNLVIDMTDVIKLNYELVIKNERMPITRESGKKGKLIIKFDVKFPSRLTLEQHAGIRSIFG